jgi:hypothetical protein
MRLGSVALCNGRCWMRICYAALSLLQRWQGGAAVTAAGVVWHGQTPRRAVAAGVELSALGPGAAHARLASCRVSSHAPWRAMCGMCCCCTSGGAQLRLILVRAAGLFAASPHTGAVMAAMLVWRRRRRLRRRRHAYPRVWVLPHECLRNNTATASKSSFRVIAHAHAWSLPLENEPKFAPHTLRAFV